MKSTYLLYTTLFLLFANMGFTQGTTENQLIKTAYYYSFKTITDSPNTDNVEQEVKSLKSVTEVKIKFKPENKIGQLIVIVQEKPRSSEGEILFQPTDLKRILSTNGFIPDELETQKLTN